jgi:hypothetical protein
MLTVLMHSSASHPQLAAARYGFLKRFQVILFVATRLTAQRAVERPVC